MKKDTVELTMGKKQQNMLNEYINRWDALIKGYRLDYMTGLGYPPVVYEINIFMPYIMYLDLDNEELTFQNRDYLPLGYYRQDEEANINEKYIFTKVDISSLPDYLKNGVDTVFCNRKMIRIDLYNGTLFPYESHKKEINEYFERLAIINKFCDVSPFWVRYNILIHNLYKKTKLVDSLQEELKKKEEYIDSMRKETKELRKIIQKLQKI